MRDRGPPAQRLSAEPSAANQLSDEAREALRAVLEMLASERSAPTAVRDPERGWRVHVADSLSGLEVEALRAARRIADLGAGAGFPGLPLAAALAGKPRRSDRGDRAQVRVRPPGDRAGGDRQCAGRLRALRELGGQAATRWGAGELRRRRGPCGGAPVDRGRACLAAAADGGVLVAWKGRRNADEEAELGRAAERLAMEVDEVQIGGPVRRLPASPPARAAQKRPDAGQPPPPPRDGEEASPGKPLRAVVGGRG